MRRITATVLTIMLCFSQVLFASATEESEAIYQEIEMLREQIAQINLQLAEKEAEYVTMMPDRQIVISAESNLLQAKKTMKLTAEVKRMVSTAPQETKVVWTSSDTKIAKIDATGKVTGVKAGNVTITACAKDDQRIFATYELEITQPVKAIELSDTVVTLAISNIDGKKVCGNYVAIATITPSDAYDKSVTWRTEDEGVATVDEYGVVTAVGIGSTKITVEANDGTKVKRALRVKVVQGAEEIIITPTEATVYTGKTIRLDEEVKPKNTANKKVQWHSDNPALATVDAKGNVQGIAPGWCTIYATATDGSGVSAACRVHVRQLVTEIKAAEPAAYMMAGTNKNLQLTIHPANATDQSVVYQTNDPAVATVDANGVISAMRRGTCQITVSACDGSAVKLVIPVHVEPVIPVEMIGMTVKHSLIGEPVLYPSVCNFSFDTDIVAFSFATKAMDAYGNVLSVQHNEDGADVWEWHGGTIRPGATWTADEKSVWTMQGIDTVYSIDAYLISMTTADGEVLTVPEDEQVIYSWKKY